MLVDYSRITASALNEAVADAIAQAENVIASIVAVDGPHTFENTIRPIDSLTAALQDAYGRGPFLGNVHPNEEVREMARETEERLEKWQGGASFRPDLFPAGKKFSEN